MRQDDKETLASDLQTAKQRLTAAARLEFKYPGVWEDVTAVLAALDGADVQALTDEQAFETLRGWLCSSCEVDIGHAIRVAKAEAALATPSPAPQALTADLLADLKVQYGMVGTSDVDVTAWNAKLDRAIAALAGAPAVQPAEPPRGFQWGLEVRGAIADLVDAERDLLSAPVVQPAEPPQTDEVRRALALLDEYIKDHAKGETRTYHHQLAREASAALDANAENRQRWKDEARRKCWGAQPAESAVNDADYVLALIDETFASVPEIKRHHDRMRAIAERLATPPNVSAEPVPEGCTPADARVLRFANHALAQESHELQDVLADLYGQVKRFCEAQGEADFETGRALYLLSRVRPMEFHWPFATPPNVSSAPVSVDPAKASGSVPQAPAGSDGA